VRFFLTTLIVLTTLITVSAQTTAIAVKQFENKTSYDDALYLIQNIDTSFTERFIEYPSFNKVTPDNAEYIISGTIIIQNGLIMINALISDRTGNYHLTRQSSSDGADLIVRVDHLTRDTFSQLAKIIAGELKLTPVNDATDLPTAIALPPPSKSDTQYIDGRFRTRETGLLAEKGDSSKTNRIGFAVTGTIRSFSMSSFSSFAEHNLNDRYSQQPHYQSGEMGTSIQDIGIGIEALHIRRTKFSLIMSAGFFQKHCAGTYHFESRETYTPTNFLTATNRFIGSTNHSVFVTAVPIGFAGDYRFPPESSRVFDIYVGIGFDVWIGSLKYVRTDSLTTIDSYSGESTYTSVKYAQRYPFISLGGNIHGGTELLIKHYLLRLEARYSITSSGQLGSPHWLTRPTTADSTDLLPKTNRPTVDFNGFGLTFSIGYLF